MKYRNPKLLRSAKDAPWCMACFADNQGNVVAAHANSGAYGKGMGTKAHDWAIAFMCDRCHAEIDQGAAGRDEKQEAWLRAHIRTMEWLFDTGRLKSDG